MVTEDKMMFKAPSLAKIDGVAHGFFTRLGGVSEGIYASLNCGPGSNDDAANVTENRARIARALGAEPGRLVSVYQKHTNTAVVAQKPWTKDKMPEADAIVTSTPGLAIGILTADCAPILLCDPEARVIGAAHAGWRGAKMGIAEAAVEAMTGLGAEPDSEAFFIIDEGSGEPHFDLPGYVAERLARAGVGQVIDLGFCTYYDETRLFSYRRSQHHGEDDYGRHISAIVPVSYTHLRAHETD